MKSTATIFTAAMSVGDRTMASTSLAGMAAVIHIVIVVEFCLRTLMLFSTSLIHELIS